MLSWLGNTPNLHPAKNLRHILKTLFRMRRLSKNRELIQAIIDSWCHAITKNQFIIVNVTSMRSCNIKQRLSYLILITQYNILYLIYTKTLLPLYSFVLEIFEFCFLYWIQDKILFKIRQTSLNFVKRIILISI